jgi:hypothetical protein
MNQTPQTPAQTELTKSVLSHVDGLMQWAFLLNGAAAAGLLTFLGNAIDKQTAFPHWNSFSRALTWFVVGLMVAIASRVFAFFSLNFMAQIVDPSLKSSMRDIAIYLQVGDRSMYCAIISASLLIGACLCFVVGVLCGRNAIFI